MLNRLGKFVVMILEALAAAVWRLAWSIVLFILMILFIVTASLAVLVHVVN